MKKLILLLLSSISCFGATLFPPSINSQQITNAIYSSATLLKNGDVGLDTMFRWLNTWTTSNRPAFFWAVGDQNGFPSSSYWGQEAGRQGRPHEGGLGSSFSDTGALRINTNGLVYQLAYNVDPANIRFSAGSYWHITNGAIITWDRITSGTGVADTNHYCDTFKLFYIKEPNAGTFKVQTNMSGTGWGDMVTLTANNGTTNGAVFTTNVPLGYVNFRVQGLTATNRIWDAAVYNSTARNYVPVLLSDASGDSFQTFTNCQTNVWLTFLQAWNPDLMVFQDTGGSNNAPAVQYLDPQITTVATNADRIYMGWVALSADNALGNFLLQQFAITNSQNVGYFDVSQIFGSGDTNALIAKGIMDSSLHVVNPAGVNLLDQMLWNRVMRVASVTNGMLAYNPYAPLGITAGNNITSTGTLAGLSFQSRATSSPQNWQWYADTSNNPRLRQNSSPYEAMYFDSVRFAWSPADVNGLPVSLGITNIPYSTLYLSNSITTMTNIGTDVAGFPLTINAGASTGTGRGGALITKTSPSATGSSSVGNVLITRSYLAAKEVVLTESSATLVFNISLPTSSKCFHCRVYATVRADDGTNFQDEGDTFEFGAVNKAGTLTAGAVSTTLISSSAASSGTLSTTWTAVVNGTGVDVKANAVSSLTQTTLNVMGWRIEIDSNDPALAVTPQ